MKNSSQETFQQKRTCNQTITLLPLQDAQRFILDEEIGKTRKQFSALLVFLREFLKP